MSKLSEDERKNRLNLIDTLSNAFTEAESETAGRADVAGAVRAAYGLQAQDSAVEAANGAAYEGVSADKTGVLGGNNGVLISGGMSFSNDMTSSDGTTASSFVTSEDTVLDGSSAVPDSTMMPSFDRDEISFAGLVDTQGRPTIDLQSVLKRSMFGGYSESSVHDLIDEISHSDAQMRAGFERQIQDLSREVASSTSECRLLRNQMEQIEAHRAKLEASLSEASTQLDLAREQSEDKHEQLSGIRSQLEQAMDMKSKLEQAVAELEAHKRDATAQIDRLKDELDRVSNELTHVSKERTDALDRLEEACASMKENASLLEAAQHKNTELEQQIETLTNELSAAQKQVATHADLVEKVEQTVQECAELSDRIEELSKTNIALVGQNNELAALCQDFETERTQLVARVAAAQDEAARARNEVAAAQQQAAQAQQDVMAAQQLVAEYKTAHGAIQKRCDELNATLTTATRQYEAVLTEMTKTRTDNQRLAEALHEAQATNNRLTSVCGKTYQVLAALLGEFDELSADASRLAPEVVDFAPDATSAATDTATSAYPSSGADAADSPAKHFCDLNDDSDECAPESELKEAPKEARSFILVDEKPAEPAVHKMSAEEYLRQRNSRQ